ncbi:MAG: 50S ribosomal protein L9 [Parcubacteria group bacterium GW2011_GWC1_41_7]|nr:MAG: 50S ribosomal protein L9 [Parcubacteria group bacterium GW2011_GWC1_41_7]
MTKRKKVQKERFLNVVLLDDVRGVGNRGEIKKVKPGFLQFLEREKKAMQVTPENLHQIEQMKLIAEKNVENNKKRAEGWQQKILEHPYEAHLVVGEMGEVFSSIGKNDIEAYLKGIGIEVQKNDIELEHSIRELGTYEILIHLGYGLSAILKIITSAVTGK